MVSLLWHKLFHRRKTYREMDLGLTSRPSYWCDSCERRYFQCSLV